MNTHKMHIASAVQLNGGKDNLNLSRDYLGTFKIGQILPILHQPCVPGDKFNIHVGTFARFLPMVVPSYVDLTFRTLSVFVPYHQVMDGAESFFANQNTFHRQSNDIPKFKLLDLLHAFSEHSDMVTEDATKAGFSIEGTYYYFSAKGYYCLKLLNSLGLRFALRYVTNTTYNKPYDALPLLAFAHAYNCYMSYSSHQNTSELSNVLETIKRNPSVYLTSSQIYTILSSILLTYEESFYSLAWRNPFYSMADAGSVTQTNGFKQLDSDAIFNTLNGGNYGAEYTYGDGVIQSDSSVELNAAQIRLMLKFDDFFRRSNYAGSKDIEQIYSRFGVKIDDYKTRYPYFLNETGQNVRIGDVTSTSDTDNAPVGAYAGKAISSDDASFRFESNDYGMLFTFAWFAPKLCYYRGTDKEFLRLQPFDFYTPELDQGFPCAVTRAQLDGEVQGNQSVVDGTYGFVPLYSEDLYANSQIIGDFDRLTGFDSWHFGRNFNLDVAAQSDAFIYVPQSGTPLERIFNVDDAAAVDVDSIYLVAHGDVSAVRPMKDFVGKSGLGSGSMDIPQLGSQAN